MLGKDKGHWLPVSKILACLFYFVYPSLILTCIMREYCGSGITSLMSKIKKAFGILDFGFWTDICPLYSLLP
jgi:hypothetical protein